MYLLNIWGFTEIPKTNSKLSDVALVFLEIALNMSLCFG